MLKLICVLYVFGFYLSILITYLKHRHYLNILFYKRGLFNKDKFIYTQVIPDYRISYFGYVGFMLPKVNLKLLTPNKYLRVFGLIHPNSKCMILYKNNVANSIIVVDDLRYGDGVMEFLRITYRNILIIINGGVLAWQVYLLYII